MLKLKLQYFDADAKNWLIWKDPDAGKDWGQEKKGATEDKMVGWDHWSMDMSVSRLEETVKDREARHAAVRGVTVWHDCVTKQQDTLWYSFRNIHK